MRMKNRIIAGLVIGGFAATFGSAADAASVYLSPAQQVVSPSFTGPLSFDLFMDFAGTESTVGGGVDISLDSRLSLIQFSPSGYFSAVADPAFSGSGTQFADGAYEVHFGSFNGLSGLNNLGTLTVSVLQSLQNSPANVDLAINNHWGNFYSAINFQPQDVILTGAVVAVPEPDMLWLLLGGLGVLGLVRRRYGSAAQLD